MICFDNLVWTDESDGRQLYLFFSAMIYLRRWVQKVHTAVLEIDPYTVNNSKRYRPLKKNEKKNEERLEDLGEIGWWGKKLFHV